MVNDQTIFEFVGRQAFEIAMLRGENAQLKSVIAAKVKTAMPPEESQTAAPQE
jgi:hypothetical protein